MRISEVLFWSDQPLESDRAERHLDIPAARVDDDLTNLRNAFTRRGAVKHFWNLNGSEGLPSGPAQRDDETELIPNGTLEPTTASWQEEPVDTEPPGWSASARSVSAVPRGIRRLIWPTSPI
jgi:hypothetical protein